MAHKWLEEWFDTLLYLTLIMGMLLFFCCYWKAEYQVRFAEVVIQEFLGEVSAEGKITITTYEQMRRNLGRIVPGCELELLCTDYVLQPVYALIEKKQLDEYYGERNVRKEIPLLQEKTNVVEEDAGELRMQEETNATILAADPGCFLPLPSEDNRKVEAVREYQEAYEGKPLITLCRVISETGVYYAEASAIWAETSGTVFLNLTLDNVQYNVPVVVECYPRILICVNGHEVVNCESVRTEWKKSGNVNCPYCQKIPVYATCNTLFLQKETGEALSKEEIHLEVEYQDGHVEQITPEEMGWQDSYDMNYCGTQQVTICYYGIESNIVVTSVNGNCVKCGRRCNGRNYEDYTAFPYCTECMSEVPLFTGEVFEEMQQKQEEELLGLLDNNGEVCLKYGSLVTIKFYRKGKCVLLLQSEVKQDGMDR